MQVVAFALEKRMFLHVQHHVKIARRPAMSPSFAEPGKTDARSVFDSSRNLGIHRRWRSTRPSPLHLAHGSVITLPAP